MIRFEVSRTVVREAISKRQASHLVATQHGIGTFALEQIDPRTFKISPVDFATVNDVISILELRISYETSLKGESDAVHTQNADAARTAMRLHLSKSLARLRKSQVA